MKKYFFLPVFMIFILMTGRAQYTVRVTYQYSFTKFQIDSILVAVTGNAQAGSLFSTNYDVKLYKVIYNTFDADSIPTTASGLLIVPQGTPCEIPILSFQHNNTLLKYGVPSYYGSMSQWYLGMAAGSIGYITLMPDGIGLGDGPGLHPFLHLQSEATSVIDMIRAVKEFVDTTGNAPNEQLFLAGVAEGAYASLAAHQYIQTYLEPELHVTATGGIAGYYDMSGTMVNMILSDSMYPDPSYLPELLLGYNKAYNFFTNDSDIMAYPYDSILPPLFNGNNSAKSIDSLMPSVPKYILTQGQIDSLQNDSMNYIRQILKKNDLYNWSPASPVYLFYCTADEYVPYQNSIVAYTHFVQNGSAMVDTLDINPTYDHAECSEFSVLSSLSLINQFIHQPIISFITASSSTSPTVPNGNATVSDTFGDPPYTWHWSTGDTTATITGLSAGTYYVTTTDIAHCNRVDSAVIQLVDGINELILTDINVYPNPTQGLLTIESNNPSETLVRIELLDLDGNAVDIPNRQNANATIINLSDEAKGIYFLNIYSQTGKELHRKIVLL